MPAKETRHIDALSLELHGEKISARTFLQSVNSFFGIVNEVTEEFCGRKNMINWIVTVSSGSAKINVIPELAMYTIPPIKTIMLTHFIGNGFERIEKFAKRPQYFTEKALKHTMSLASNIDGELNSIKVVYNGKMSLITSQTAANTSTLLKTAYKDWGSVEGVLCELSDKRTTHVSIYDDLTDTYIKCKTNKDTLMSMYGSFHKRILVSGQINYYESGQIKHIEVEEFEVFPGPDQIPSFEDVRGILGAIE